MHRDNVYIAPSGVQKERLKPDDLFVMDLPSGNVLRKPSRCHLKMSQCTPLFWNCYTLRPSTRACIHTHSIHAVMVTLLAQDREAVELTHLEMIKGIRIGESKKSFNYYDRLVIPIIENTAWEEDLKDSMAEVSVKF
jgi:methylthioribulose-1-phosphate dehydratase